MVDFGGRILRPVRSASICFTCHRVACVVFQPRCCICVSGSHFYPRDRTIMEVIMEPKSWVFCSVSNINAFNQVFLYSWNDYLWRQELSPVTCRWEQPSRMARYVATLIERALEENGCKYLFLMWTSLKPAFCLILQSVFHRSVCLF